MTVLLPPRYEWLRWATASLMLLLFAVILACGFQLQAAR